MTRALLQVAELAALTGIAAGAHLYVAHRRRPFEDALEATAGHVMRAVVAVADVVVALLYVAFATAVLPATGPSPVPPAEIERTLDTVATFTVLVALVQVYGHLVLHRVAAHLEPWPPRVDAAPEAH